MRTLAIRYWLVAALAIFFVTSVAPFVYIGAVYCASARPPQGAVDLANRLSADVSRWNDPEWQKELTAKLPPDLSVVLLSPNGERELFHVGKTPLDPTDVGYTRVMVMDGKRQVGIANLYNVSPCGGEIYGNVAIPASLLVQILVGFGIAWVLTRYVLRPLAALSQAARHIAKGNLDFQLPSSRVREVAEVATAFHAMGDDLRLSLTRQAELEQERRFFVSAIAHDLRTPLFALRGYLEGLEKGLATTPEKVAHYIAVCQEKADMLEHLIADLFAYSRLEYLEQSPHKEPLDFSKLVSKAIDDVRLQAETKNVSLSVDGAPGEVQGDGLLLARALNNLLDNALRHTPSGGSIRITWIKTDGKLRFTVADTGPGIDSHDLPHLFKPLYRAEGSRNRETGGAGLGLAIARRILQVHGGDLSAANRAGGGAEFTGWLPV
jgi:signal transduction histidine kinase